MIRFLLFSLLFFSVAASAQDASLQGRIYNASGETVPGVTIQISGNTKGTFSDKEGQFNLQLPSGKKQRIIISHVGFIKDTLELLLQPGEVRKVEVKLQPDSRELTEFVIEDKESRKSTMQRIDPKLINIIPSTTGGVEALIKTFAGVVSNNDLSSQYSVRGGNFDENLVYVNDIEIFRPFLVRSGQQEGLSFVNGDMVSSLLFSAGGFEARYGDKMSSVLDVRYKRPQKFGGAVGMGTLGGSVQLEGVSKNDKFSWMAGFRQKQNAYLLNSLDVKGNYKPSFSDFQTFLTYEPNKKWEFNVLGNFARNKYEIIPTTQQTDVGTINQALRFTVYFEGQERDVFQNGMLAFSSTYKHSERLRLKWIVSGFRSQEKENYDILGAYRLDELENDFGKDDFGQVKFNLGAGAFLNHARNELNASIYNLEHRGFYDLKNHLISWGLRGQQEIIDDRLKEWKYVDSAGYAIPQYPANTVNMMESYSSINHLNTSRLSGFIQDQLLFRDSSIFGLTAGVRFNYWTLNNQFLLSPRATFSIKPKWQRDFLFRFSSGYYYQPPFYRELRDQFGILNRNILAQQSIHFVAAMDYNLKLWHRPFKIVAEGYYKILDNLIPYQIDNVRIRYFAQNNAKGYARGIDLKMNGEFVKGVESWASISYMKTEEDIQGDYYYNYYNAAGEKIIPNYNFDQVKVDSIRFEPGFIPRPTDQRVSFGLFFQDYIPRFPSYKMSLNLLFGSGMPFGPPDYKRYKQTLRYPFYRRVDLGLSKQLISEASELGPRNPFRHLSSMWISLDVFNLLGINNVVSYNWIKDVNNRIYAVPNYLSARLINLRLQATF